MYERNNIKREKILVHTVRVSAHENNFYGLRNNEDFN